MISTFFGIIYGIGLGITLAVIISRRVIFAYLGIKSAHTGLAITILKIVGWPITWAIFFKKLWALIKEENVRR